ncbi:UNVERIFIED_CONTAM: hypothetical protein GTU68_010335 [Idotea baltica]|nr:hypothetical protein [Idotea baltica]
MYVCGPTVYGDPHLGHARSGVTYDVVFRFLQNKEVGPGYKVRYVRNITDVEDKILKKARLEQLEPMEVVQKYVLSYHKAYASLNMLPPSIEPTASGHIIEQIEMVQQILDNGLAYEVEGNIYFDIAAYDKEHGYGKLSGRVLDELMSSDRVLDGQDLKRNKFDFALWKKASPEHIMKWPSPWGLGFPGWHIECSVMSSKYLGETFDIHGGGMDLLFPHHDCEIAQSVAAVGKEPVKYWMHNNMITLNGQKMAKSVGDHPLLERSYGAMTIRFFMLQSHYRSTLDFSNEALQAAEKGHKRLLNAYETPTVNEAEEKEINKYCDQCVENINDDFNTAQLIARLFDLSKKINAFADGQLDINTISISTFERIQSTFRNFLDDVLAINMEEGSQDTNVTDGLMNLVLELRKASRDRKDWDTSDQIRDQLAALNIVVKDGKDGSNWSIN